MNFALFSSDSPQTLLSLGQLHSCGGSYHTRSTPNKIEISTDLTTILDITPLLDNSNLYTANLPFMLATMNKNPHLQHPPNSPPPTTLFTLSIRKFIQHHPPQSNPLITTTLKAFNSPIIKIPTSAVPLSAANIKPPKKITLQQISKEGIKNLGPIVEIMADAEHLFAHKNAVTVRLES
jgi:hypothetical protein